MRGTRLCTLSYVMRLRIIPADAGNTPVHSELCYAPQDHPRGCGEHILKIPRKAWVGGSSPRMRGTPALPACFILSAGIIPADAGNTVSTSLGPMVCGDHPRGCGEHHTVGIVRSGAGGSSPRMRGTRPWPVWGESDSGIIPADAGNTLTALCPYNMAKDHPRGCGEHWSDNPVVRFAPGSSPRMRGTLHVYTVSGKIRGIIPADAGNTSVTCGGALPEADHPRGCGEHRRYVDVEYPIRGSSPRMQGTLIFSGYRLNWCRIIPADAGNTG